MIHELKTDPEVWDAVYWGDKTFEIRRDDRGFAIGDVLRLKKTKHTGLEMQNGEPLIYTGEECRMRVAYILHGPVYGLQSGWVIMSVEPL